MPITMALLLGGTLGSLGCFAEGSPPNSPIISSDLTNVAEPSPGQEGRGDKREDRVQDFTRFWLVEVTGTVVRVERLNLDKSGKNPKWMISFWMDCEEVEPEKLPQGFLLQEKEWKVKDFILKKWQEAEPVVGERLKVTGSGLGTAPSRLEVTSLSRL